MGKTTTMRSIMGLTPPTRGRVEWKGRDITRRAPYEVAKLGIGFVPEDRRIFADLTVWENLDVATRRHAGTAASPSSGSTSSSPSWPSCATGRAVSSPGGEQQMLTIARTLMGNPELLLLDEPSEGLAPLVVEHLGEQIGRLKRDGLTILLAEQNVDFSLELADRVYVLEKGPSATRAPPRPSAPTSPSATSTSRSEGGSIMEIGCHLPTQGPLATGEALTAFCRAAEARQVASLWVSDHVIFPRHETPGYPGGRFPHPPDQARISNRWSSSPPPPCAPSARGWARPCSSSATGIRS